MTFSIQKPATSYDLLWVFQAKRNAALQPDEEAIRVDFRLLGYRWVIKGSRGLKMRDGSWAQFSIIYPVGKNATIVLS